jgi:hypothetical protein
MESRSVQVIEKSRVAEVSVSKKKLCEAEWTAHKNKKGAVAAPEREFLCTDCSLGL